MSKISRNDPCPCGSGKKYKKCCLKNNQPSVHSFTRKRIRQTESEVIQNLLAYARKHFHENLILAAWDEFVVWQEIEMFDEEFAADIDPNEYLPEPVIEFDTLFTPWFLFHWMAENYDELKPDDENDKPIFPEDSLAALYLKDKGKYLSPFTKSFITQSISQPFSYFLITHVVAGKQITVKDLFIEHEITVEEILASQTLTTGTIIFARVITIENISVFFGMAPYAIPRSYHQYFIEYREDILSENKSISAPLLLQYADDFREVYFEIREQLLNPQIPELRNTDGEKLQIINLHYNIECTIEEAFQALKTLSLLSVEELYQDGLYNTDGELISIDFTWMEKGNKQHSGWDNTVKGLGKN